jgi:heptosyltransferase-2
MGKVLVVGPAWVGDMVMAQALFRRLKKRAPAPVLGVAAPRSTAPLLERMPEVDRVHALDAGHGEFALGARWRLGRELASEGYDEAIVIPRSLKAALAPFLAGVPRRRGARGEWRFGLLNDMPAGAREGRTVDAFLALDGGTGATLAEDEAPQLAASPAAGRALAELFGIDLGRPLIALCPGAEYGPAKRWPAEHFAALAQDLIAGGAEVALLGGPRDRDAAASAAAVAGVRDLTGATRLGEAIDLLALARAVVTNDSGLMHVAAALGRPLVALFGSSSPARTPPLSPCAEILALDLDCRPCFARVCPLGHTNCLVGLEPARVAAAVRRAAAL